MELNADYTDQEIIDGFLTHSKAVVQYVYENYYTLVKSIIMQNKGTEDDAYEIFQNTMVQMYYQLTEKKVQIKSSFKNYFLTVSRNIWIQELNRRGHLTSIEKYEESKENKGEEDAEQVDKILDEKDERRLLYLEHFRKISKECQTILRMRFDKIPFKKVAYYFGLKNEHQAKKKKYRCKKMLLDKIRSDPKFKHLNLP